MMARRSGLVLALAAAIVAAAAEPRVFTHTAAVSGTTTPLLPMRVPLPPAMMRLTNGDVSDVRLFDDQGAETPFVLHPRAAGSDREASITLELLDYQREGDVETLVLRPPVRTTGAPPVGPLHLLELVTDARDFRRPVTIATSADRVTW